jgi:hypothetical protein
MERPSVHAANTILDALNENFGNCVILNHLQGFPFMHSLSHYTLAILTAVITFLCGYMEENLYKNNPHTIVEFEEETSPVATLSRVTANSQHHLHIFLDVGAL